MKLSARAQQALLMVNVAASHAGAEIVGASHAAYYMASDVSPGVLLHQLDLIQQSFPKLAMAVAELDKVRDELLGIPSPVKVDEQEAA